MAKKEKRFDTVYEQGEFGKEVEIWIDRKTGVNYLWVSGGYSGGLTPLLDAYGKPVISPVPREE